jgi:hypothetical protein
MFNPTLMYFLVTHVLLQDLSLWLYGLALLHITPSPLWCTSYVEASYSRLTASSTHPQVRTKGVLPCMWCDQLVLKTVG